MISSRLSPFRSFTCTAFALLSDGNRLRLPRWPLLDCRCTAIWAIEGSVTTTSLRPSPLTSPTASARFFSSPPAWKGWI